MVVPVVVEGTTLQMVEIRQQILASGTMARGEKFHKQMSEVAEEVLHNPAESKTLTPVVEARQITKPKVVMD
jgi:hypothetical protein